MTLVSAWSIDEEAICFFVERLSVISHGHSNLGGRGTVELCKVAHSNGMVMNAVACVGLAALSNVKGDPRTMVVARTKYATVLRETITAIQNPTPGNIENIMKCIGLLAVFDVSANTNHIP